MPNNKKYCLISVGLAIAIHISLALLINQSLSFAHSLPNKLSLKLMSSYGQPSSLEPSPETIAQEPDNSLKNVQEQKLVEPSTQKSDNSVDSIQEQKPVELNSQKPDIIEPKKIINKPEELNISQSKSASPTKPQEPKEVQKKQTANNLQAPQDLQAPVSSQNLQNSQSFASQKIEASKAYQAQNSGPKINRPAKIDFQRGVYPAGAKLRGEEGTCVLLLTISTEAQIIKAELETSSSYTRLDEAALKYALDPKANHKIEVALANGQAVEAKILVNVHFRLTSS